MRRILIKERKRFEEMKENSYAIISEWNIANTEIKQIYDSAWQVGDLINTKQGKSYVKKQENYYILVTKLKGAPIVNSKQLEKVYDILPAQLIHRDVHFGNFLFEGGHFSGYIDFDLSQRNIRIFDLCYFMLGLLCEDAVKLLNFVDLNTQKILDVLKRL